MYIRIFLVLLLLTSSSPVIAGNVTPLTLAVLPYLADSEIYKRFTPLVNHLSAELGRPVELRIGRNYEANIEAIGNDQVDIAFLGPATYIAVVDQYEDKPILGRFVITDHALLHGVIATHKESKLQQLYQLRDVRFAFGDRGSTTAHILPRAMLFKAGIPEGLPRNHQYLGSHNNVALGILSGDYDAGAMKKEVFDNFKDRGLRALAISSGVPDYLFVARADLPAKELAQIRQIMLTIHKHAHAEMILRGMHKKLLRLEPAASDDYQPLRKIVHSMQTEGL